MASALGHDPEAQDYKAKLAMDQKVYFQYYIQDDVEDGTLMDTKIPIKEVRLLESHQYVYCDEICMGKTSRLENVLQNRSTNRIQKYNPEIRPICSFKILLQIGEKLFIFKTFG